MEMYFVLSLSLSLSLSLMTNINRLLDLYGDVFVWTYFFETDLLTFLLYIFYNKSLIFYSLEHCFLLSDYIAIFHVS